MKPLEKVMAESTGKRSGNVGDPELRFFFSASLSVYSLFMESQTWAYEHCSGEKARRAQGKFGSCMISAGARAGYDEDAMRGECSRSIKLIPVWLRSSTTRLRKRSLLQTSRGQVPFVTHDPRGFSFAD